MPRTFMVGDEVLYQGIKAVIIELDSRYALVKMLEIVADMPETSRVSIHELQLAQKLGPRVTVQEVRQHLEAWAGKGLELMEHMIQAAEGRERDVAALRKLVDRLGKSLRALGVPGEKMPVRVKSTKRPGRPWTPERRRKFEEGRAARGS